MDTHSFKTVTSCRVCYLGHRRFDQLALTTFCVLEKCIRRLYIAIRFLVNVNAVTLPTDFLAF